MDAHICRWGGGKGQGRCMTIGGLHASGMQNGKKRSVYDPVLRDETTCSSPPPPCPTPPILMQIDVEMAFVMQGFHSWAHIYLSIHLSVRPSIRPAGARARAEAKKTKCPPRCATAQFMRSKECF